MSRKLFRGQVGLLVIVVLGVVISLALGVAVRSLGNVSLSRQSKEDEVVFNVAEQGVEDALRKINNGDLSGGTMDFNNGLFSGSYTIAHENYIDVFVPEGDVLEVNTNGLDGQYISIYWSLGSNASETSDLASLEVVSVRNDGSILNRWYYCNPNNCHSGDGATPTGNNPTSNFRSGGSGFYVSPGVSKMRLRPLYNGATIRVEGLAENQFYVVQSSAENSGNNSKLQANIELKRTASFAPSFMDYAIFTMGTVVK